MRWKDPINFTSNTQGSLAPERGAQFGHELDAVGLGMPREVCPDPFSPLPVIAKLILPAASR